MQGHPLPPPPAKEQKVYFGVFAATRAFLPLSPNLQRGKGHHTEGRWAEQEPQGAEGWHVVGLGTRRWGEDGRCELDRHSWCNDPCNKTTVYLAYTVRPRPPNARTSPPTQPTASLTCPPRAALPQLCTRASARLAAWGEARPEHVAPC